MSSHEHLARDTAAPLEDTAESASWHPALRPNNDGAQPRSSATETDTDDFFERYPNVTPKKQQQTQQPQQIQQPQTSVDSVSEPLLQTQAQAEGVTANAWDDVEGYDRVRQNSISVERVLHIQHSAASEEDLSRGPSSYAEARGPVGWHAGADDEEVDEFGIVTPMPMSRGEGNDEEEDMLFRGPHETIEEQRRHLAEAEPASDPNMAREEEVVEAQAAEHPEAGYDYQGEVTAMEAAQDGEPDAPLLDDEEPPPTIVRLETEKEGESEEPMDGAASPTQPPAKAVAAPPHIDRSFTTNFTEMPVTEMAGEEEMAQGGGEEVWATDEDGGEDDMTFGELLGDGIRVERPLAGEPWQGENETDPFEQIANTSEVTSAQNHAEDHLEINEDRASGNAKEAEFLAPEPADGEDIAAAFQAALDDDDLLELDESNDLDPSKFFGEDEDGLLEDDVDGFLSDLSAPVVATQQSQQTRNLASQYQPVQSPPQQQSSYAAYSTSPTFLQNHGRGAGTPDTGLFDIYNTQPNAAAQQVQPQRPPMATAQSFADKSKGGYQSPYDLPMEVVKPARRRPAQQGQNTVSAPVAPPRTSSFSASSASKPPGSTATITSPPTSSHGRPTAPHSTSSNSAVASIPSSARSTPQTDSSFFADLPMTVKPRARPSGAAYTPAGSVPGTPSQYPPGPTPGLMRQGSGYMPAMPQPHPSRGGAVQPPAQQGLGLQQQLPRQPPQQAEGYADLGFRQPEKMPLLPDLPTSASTSAPQGAAALANSRYSPAPPAQSYGPTTSRYSPAPNSLPGQNSGQQRNAGTPPFARVPSANQYAPRTSSPLAFAHEKALPSVPSASPPKVNGGSRYSPAQQPGVGSQIQMQPAMQGRQPPPPQHSQPPMQQPPVRPRTQSPVSVIKSIGGMTGFERPGSAIGSNAYKPTQQLQQQQQQQQQRQMQQQGSSAQSVHTVLPHRRQFSRDLAFAAPNDERAQDPLERWKGGPIFRWTAAGSVVTSFPARTPFYGGGGGQGPMLKCTSGDIKISDAGTMGLSVGAGLMDEADAEFPGPLAAKSKGRKKQVLAWMKGKIEGLETAVQRMDLGGTDETEERRRPEEKVMLWKAVRLYVENDGVLEGSKKLEEEIRAILVSDLADRARAVAGMVASPISAGGFGSAALASEPVDRLVLEQIRQALLEGQRERAVWLAEEKKLWGHAMLLASTLGPDIWKQIVQSFVRSQVQGSGDPGARSLAAAYQVFAGNGEEVVDALVPASARAGFRMVSAADGVGGLAGEGVKLEGLESWQETLGLVVGNRTPGDGEAVARLGRLLAGYGRVEAAGVCFLSGRMFAKFGGADEVADVGGSDFVLLGGVAGQKGSAAPSGKGMVVGSELDSIILTEVYEWACSLATPAPAMPYLPHLQPYKLLHAQTLAACGLKVQAQAYCDHIITAYTSATRPSQYYHPVFTQSVADLSALLSHTPASGEGGKGGLFGGLGKPGMAKSVASGAGSWFSKFVAGEEDGAGRQSAEGMVVPGDQAVYGRISGGPSRTASRNDVYSPLGGMVPAMPGQPQSAFVPANGDLGSANATPPQGRYAPSAYGGMAVQKASPTAGHGSSLAASSPYTPQFSTPMQVNNAVTSPLSEPGRSLGVPTATLDPRPGSAPRASSRSRYAPSPVPQGLGVQAGMLNRAASDYGVPYASAGSPGDSRRGSAQELGSQGSYQPSPMLASVQDLGAYAGYQPLDQLQQEQSEVQNFSPEREEDSEDAFGPKGRGLGFGFEAAESAETAGGYEPPSYQPYQPEPEAEDEGTETLRPKKKGMMDLDDDDDEIARRAAALKKSQADREADELFRKAAEADAARDGKGGGAKDAKAAGGGWFKGGWFGGKKDPSAELNSNKPIRAKLGEESSFYYDETLKKWVNKKGGAEAVIPVAATPPPPKGLSSRVTSGISAPPSSGPPSRVASAAGSAFGGTASRPGTSSGLPPSAMNIAMNGGFTGPPSRAGTPADDGHGHGHGLQSDIGAGTAGDMAPPPPPSLPRPASSLSTASSLDDLLAGPRKTGPGGTVRGKKKGRYVDVMAK
ncbi:hypothetical protein LTR62_007777 [Meristemomyces frigidus]|uniref:Protein transport protein sec16 n=1 Tax=Meristemomyces frigidus TaxID=1508187 RepID=A0AAN7TA53_9PEZI|nr:hypothetical protein LTR62_007777 [Meristemomyces frigidus]